MLRHKYIDRVCIFFCILALALTAVLINGEALGLQAAASTLPYENRLFDDSYVHTLEIVVDESVWQSLLDNASGKEYISATLVIDGEAFKNVGLRTKGNSSLSMMSSMDSDRYSLKVEFDHYDSSTTYYGLDKMVLNNSIQDTTYLKDYLTYHMMEEMGVASPLSSFVYVSVNGEEFGLYLAVEALEDSFMARNYSGSGRLYKPDSMQMGGGGGMGGRGGNGASLQYTDDEFDSYSTIWDGAVFDITDSDKERLIESLHILDSGQNLEEAVDIEATLRYFVVHNFVLNFDSYTGSMQHNYYLYEEDGQLSMLPWDYNLAFGSFGGGSGTTSATSLVNFPIDTPVSGTTMEARPLLGKLLENPQYLELYHQLFDEFITEYFESGRFIEEYSRVVELISPYVKKDPTAFYGYESFLSAGETLREFCLLRAESIRGQLAGTIPSTSEGQTADGFALIDAGEVNISETGSMGESSFGERGNRQASGEDAQERAAQNIDLSELIKPAVVQEGDETSMDLPEQAAAENEAEVSRAENGDGTEGEMPEGGPPDMEEGWQMPEGGGGRGGFGGQGGPGVNRPGAEMGTEAVIDNSALYLFAVSLVILLLGLLFVRKYRKF